MHRPHLPGSRKLITLKAAMLLLAVALMGIYSAVSTTGEQAYAQSADRCNTGTNNDGYWRFTTINFNTGATASSNYQDPGIDNCVGDGGAGVLAQAFRPNLIFQRQICKGSKCSYPILWNPYAEPDRIGIERVTTHPSWPSGQNFEEVASRVGASRPHDSTQIYTIIYRHADAVEVPSTSGTRYATSAQTRYGSDNREQIESNLQAGREFYLIKSTCNQVTEGGDQFFTCGNPSRMQAKVLNSNAAADPPNVMRDVQASQRYRHILVSWSQGRDLGILRYEYRAARCTALACDSSGDTQQAAIAEALDGVAWQRMPGVELYDTRFALADPEGPTAIQTRAVNVDGAGPSTTGLIEIASYTPPAPTGLRVINKSDTSVSLRWDDPDDSTLTGYEYRLGNSGWSDISRSTSRTTSFTLTGLQAERSYTIYIRAETSTNRGLHASVTVTTNAAPPPRSSNPAPNPRSTPPPYPYGAATCAGLWTPATPSVNNGAWHWHLHNSGGDDVIHAHTPKTGGCDGHRH